jgi:hypothetical protein
MGVRAPDSLISAYTYDDFLALIDSMPSLHRTIVRKERQLYSNGILSCEITRVRIGMHSTMTICCESSDAETLLRAITQFGMGKEHNVNYLRAIQHYHDAPQVADD